MINLELIKTFEGGHSSDLKDNVEKNNTFQKGINGCLYSENGAISFEFRKGTKLVYQNDQIVKYLGYYSFHDEIILMAKCLKPVEGVPLQENITTYNITADTFTVTVSNALDTEIIFVDQISTNSNEISSTQTITRPPNDETDFDTNYSCSDSNTLEIDFAEYYGVSFNIPNMQACAIQQNIVPLNNVDYYDCFLSIKPNEDNVLVGTLLWIGMQNWPMEAKITTEGVEENEFYKRVYYTDGFNPRRVMNKKDPSLLYREGWEFNQILNNVLLQPEIVSVEIGGQLKAMKTLYVHRIISENGQLSEFSPTSFFVDILPEDEAIRFRGGDISEATGKLVNVKCNIINPEPTAEIECIALEYEAFGVPTAIRNLGRKAAGNVVEFKHYGNEQEFIDNITFVDIIDYKNTWKYCNDFSSKKNKLIAAGLRNDPVPTSVNNLEYLFPLHSWDINGATHSCLMNPRPWEYRYIDPSNTDTLIYIKQKVYRTLLSFGPLTLTFNGIGGSIEKEFPNLSIRNYTNLMPEVIIWLLDQEANNINFPTYFPNLDIRDVAGQLLFAPIDINIQTDMSLYTFSSNNQQFIENFDNDIQFLPVAINTGNLVYGAQSIGFNDGVGIRITFREVTEPVLEKATAVYDGSGQILNYKTPSFEKYCMKGEIYRLAFQAYDKDSTKYFSIPIGDIMVPEIGDLKAEIDDNGTVIRGSSYLNQKVVGNLLHACGLKMHIEVRLSCELQKLIPMYQLLYVERTEENRTILCQGLAWPLNRVQDSGSNKHELPASLKNKWTLNYNGGPSYEKQAFYNYDTYGENYNYEGENDHVNPIDDKRTIAHRGLISFDSPDLYFGKVSSKFIKSSKLNILGRLNTDHTPGVIMERGGDVSGGSGWYFGEEAYPKFSRKILEQQLEGDNHSSTLPKFATEEDYNETWETHFVNVSVYSKFNISKRTMNVKKAESLSRGEIISGAAFDIDHDVSNNAFVLPSMPWYYGSYQRMWTFQDGNPTSEIFDAGKTSPGYATEIIKTDGNLFTPEFVGPDIHAVDPQIRLGGAPKVVYDTVPLINIFKNNREFVYGGRSREAFTLNTYIPLTKTIPVLGNSNAIQFFDVGADTYLTLNIRVKNDYSDEETVSRDLNNHGGARDRGDITVHERKGAWAYAAVLETQVEPKLTYEYEFYRESGPVSFEASRIEVINTAYFNENNLKTYIPKPFKFKDDPNQGNVIAISDVKLAGEPYDSWTRFRPNNFYAELEKNKGDVSNLVKQDDEVYAIQARQTSLLYIGVDRMLTDVEGNPVNVKQGSGDLVEGHKVISLFGTNIRRAVVESEYGFTFIDENKVEFVKLQNPLFVANLLHLEYFNLFKNNNIIDTEAYFDQEKKETNILVRTKDGTSYTISYNEALKCFNGQITKFDRDIYIMFNERVYAPIRINTTVNDIETILSKDIHQLNEGDFLNFFNNQEEMVLGFYVNMQGQLDKIFQYKAIGAISDLRYPIKKIFFKSNLEGYDRTIFGTHDWYKIREGKHTVPAINDSNEYYGNSDIRGSWVYVEITMESLNKNKGNILAVINNIRLSHQ